MSDKEIITTIVAVAFLGFFAVIFIIFIKRLIETIIKKIKPNVNEEPPKEIKLDKMKIDGFIHTYKSEIAIRFLDIMKWTVILMIAGAIFYLVCPKYRFGTFKGLIYQKANKITGSVEIIRKR